MSRDLSSDTVLVVGVARRDQAALAELYRRHGGSLFCAALRVLSVRPLAEEVVQDIFTRLWQNPDRTRPVVPCVRSCWLSATVEHPTSSAPRAPGDVVKTVKANALKPEYVLEDEVIDFVAGQKLREAVATLSEKQQQAMSLAYFGGHSYVDAASLLGVPEGTVKSRIRSGLTRLRCAVMELGIDPRGANTVLCEL